ncbi:MAG: sensor histidine kinase [Spirochaetes bacterium]|nr:sensor histidine kinase [Spirochaetota bacterium]
MISDFELNSKTAIPVGIIINELMTNIFKYAFKKNSGNHVLIEISKTGNVVSIIVQDNGVGITERRRLNDTPGFGLTIINMLTEQLGGTYTIESQNGTKFIIEFEYE